MSLPNDLPERDVALVLESAFDGAKRRDEFEFCRAILREQCINSSFLDPLFESRRLIHQIISLLEAPVEESLKLRLMLLMYSHCTQMRDVYHVIGNLLRITAGHPYTADLFADDPVSNQSRASTPAEKAGRIAEWACDAGLEEVGELVTEMLVPNMQRALAESAYALDESKFYAHPDIAAPRNAEGESQIKLEWLLLRMNRGVAVALTFIDTTQRHLFSYQSNKTVPARLNGSVVAHFELLAKPGLGLSGYRPAEPAPVQATAPNEQPPETPL